MEYPIWAWAGFGIFILAMLALDLGVLNRKAHVIKYREAVAWSIVWITLALLFCGGVYWRLGAQTGLEFLTGYIIELSLSVDNLFVFILIFSYFKVPAKFQHRVLFWGVMGALVMRITMIGLGAALIDRFHWVIYLFGAFLIYTGLKMLRQDETDVQPEDNPVVKFVTRYIPITRSYDGEKFFTEMNGRRMGTLMLLVLITVEVTDLVFAVDSIPAIFGITTNTFIVYTSNVFAILGLRSLYFLVAGVIEKFHYLKIGLSIVLTFVGVKMLTEGLVEKYFHLGKDNIIVISLGVVAVVLVGSVIASVIWPKEAETHVELELPPGFDSPFDDEKTRRTGDSPSLPKAKAAE
jgi:tellurite resistance protein TerC